MKFWLRPLDTVIIVLTAFFTFIAIYKVYIAPQEHTRVLIRAVGGEWTFPVDAEETVIVSGSLGSTTVKIKGNRAWIENSPCINQNCVAAGEITRQGQWAACLPNNVLLMIQGGGGNDVDSVAW